jgi:hypothetical protein
MANTTYVPQGQNRPFGLQNTNAQSSLYGQESQYNPTESNLIAKAIKKHLFDAAPAQYNALKILFNKPYRNVLSDEFEYLEYTFGRTAIESTGAVAAQVAAVGANQTQIIPLTAASIDRISLDLIITYPDGTKGTIVLIAGLNITVNSVTNLGLPAVAIGDIFSIHSTIIGDGMDEFKNFSRLEKIDRYNYVQFFLRAQRWGEIELQKFKNTGTTNYLTIDKGEKVKQLRIDLFNSMWNGQRGEYNLSNAVVAKGMGGIYPTMIAAGSASANPTLGGLKSAFESLAFATNYKVEGGTRFMYGTDENLYNFSQIYKQPGLRYEPNDEIANLRLKKIEIGTQNIVLVPTELWREQACFPADWAKRLIILDQDTITPVKMQGIPAMNAGGTLNREGAKGSREHFQDFYVTTQLSLEFNNPTGSFIIDIQ